MKFAHEFQEALKRGGFPDDWVQSAIAYGQLKKCIKRVKQELASLGLDVRTLNHLLHGESTQCQDIATTSEAAPVAYEYNFVGKSFYGPSSTSDTNTLSSGDFHNLRPRLTFIIDTKDGIAIDASLSPQTRKYFEELAAKQHSSRGRVFELTSSDEEFTAAGETSSQRTTRSIETSSDEALRDTGAAADRVKNIETSAGFSNSDGGIEHIEVPLRFDIDFFDTIRTGLTRLDDIQHEQRKTMAQDISALGKVVAKAADPSKSNSDMYKWRELFDIYLQASIFFSKNECDTHEQDTSIAVKRLQWFRDEATRHGFPMSFRQEESRQALKQFLQINISILRSLKFQEINQTALLKILKSELIYWEI